MAWAQTELSCNIHAQADGIMTSAKQSTIFQAMETGGNLSEALDANKTTSMFPVVSVPSHPNDSGNFMGIISRTR